MPCVKQRPVYKSHTPQLEIRYQGHQRVHAKETPSAPSTCAADLNHRSREELVIFALRRFCIGIPRQECFDGSVDLDDSRIIAVEASASLSIRAWKRMFRLMVPIVGSSRSLSPPLGGCPS